MELITERVAEIAPSDESIATRIAEMIEVAGDSETVNVPIDPRIDVAVLTADDPSPMFVNVETLRTGVSRTNRRYYNNDVVNQISAMTPGVQGFLGHPDPNKVGFEFRDPQCIFVGSMVQELQDGSGGLRSIAKAYIFKSSNLREWIPKSIGAGNALTVSINGTADIARDTINNIIHVRSMNQLDSIDWANPGTEGVGTARAISVVSELQKGGNIMDPIVKTPELIKGVTVTELKAYNTEAVSGIIKSVTIQELQASNPDLYKQIAESAKITEMQLNIDGKEQAVKLVDVQGIINGKDTKVSELQGKVLDSYKIAKIAELVPEIVREQVSKKVSGKTEAEIDESIKTEIAYVQELAGKGGFKLPSGKGARKDSEDLQNAVVSLFGSKKKDTK